MQRLTIALSLLAILLAAGCGKKDPFVAKVGTEIISEAQYREAMLTQFRSDDNIKQRTLDERKKVAHDMALEEAKYLEGLARKYDANGEIAENIASASKRKALDLLYKDKVINEVISEASLRDYYDKSAKEVSARHILIKKSAADSSDADRARLKSRIDSIHTAIKSGLDFKAAAAMLSEDATTARDSGDLSWFPWGRMVDEFQRAAWTAKKHELVGPVESPFGWHLIMVDSTRDVQGRPSFEDSKDDLALRLREQEGQKLSDRAREYVNKLHDDYKLVVDQTVTGDFVSKLKDPQMTLSKELGPMFTQEEKDRVAATHSLGQVKVSDMIEKVGGNAYRVDWNNPQSVVDLVNAIVEPQFLEDIAAKEGFVKRAENDPEVLKQKRAAIVRLLEKVEVADKVEQTEETDKAYYEQHLQEFIQPETRTIREIFIKEDSSKAARVLARAKSGEDFRKLAWQFNEKESTKRDSGRIGPFDEKRFGLIGKTAFQLEKSGAISDIVKIGKNFSIVQLMDVFPSRTKSWEEAKSDARREYRVAKTKQLSEELEKMLTSRYPITIDEEKLTAMWPLPPERQERAARDQ
ncbi:MAG: peptidylprolyl isomerase [Calditrichaeota bacterium]|nr:peptidylprolyl isomerase [Calditrichota bacterium]